MTVINLQVPQSSDDATEGAGGAVSIASATVSQTSAGAWTGVRFQNVTIPPGSTINSATLQVYCHSTTGDDPAYTVRCEDIDDAPTFTNAANDISNRTPTTANLSWSGTGLGSGFLTVGDITSLVQEVIGRGGWASGNDIAVIFDAETGVNFTWRLYDSDPAAGATLDIDYTAPAPGASKPYYYAGLIGYLTPFTLFRRLVHATSSIIRSYSRTKAALFSRS